MADADWSEKAAQLTAAMLVAAARRQAAKLVDERDAALQKLRDVLSGASGTTVPFAALVSAEERGRLLGEWAGVLIHTEGMVELLEDLVDQKDEADLPEALRKEVANQRAHITYLRARPPRPSSFTDDDELRELRRAEAEAAITALRYRERRPEDDDEWKRLHTLWANAAARVNALEAKIDDARQLAAATETVR